MVLMVFMGYGIYGPLQYLCFMVFYGIFFIYIYLLYIYMFIIKCDMLRNYLWSAFIAFNDGLGFGD